MSDTQTVVFVKKVSLTHAQILSLPATPVDLIVAQGSGSIILPLSAIIKSHIVTPYSNIDVSSIMWFGVDNGSSMLVYAHEVINGAISAILGNAGDYLSIFPQLFLTNTSNSNIDPNGGNLFSDFDNQPLKLVSGNGGSGNFTGGNAANQIDITISYSIVAP